MAEKTNVPEIRFAGFTDPWEQRKFSDMYVVNNERNANCELGYDRTLSIATMTFNGGNGAADDSLSNYKIIRIGDIAFEGHTNKVHAYGRFVLNDAGDGLMSPRFSCLRPIVEQRYSFWKYYIPREESMRPILVNATKSGTMMNELVPDDLMRESILVPCLAEQEIIGNSLSQLDHLITLHQRKYDKLAQLKKSMLDKMFPKPGERFPEIRFAGFTDPWEQRKLGSIAASFDYGLNAAATEYDGQNKYLRITDIDDTTHEFLKRDLTTPLADLAMSADYLLEEGDLLFARTGASVGKTYLYRQYDGTVYFAGFLIRARIGESADPEFVYQATLTDAYKKYVAITSQRSGQPGVNAQEYADYQLMLPSRTEQQQIGMTLRSLDDLITLHQRKLELLRNTKKSLLDRMFV